MYKDYLDINPEVEGALDEGRPVVALESTIIAHGMPYPKNVETALAVEEVIKKNGAVPATIGILGGRIKIGLTKEEIEYMAHADNVLKVSRRDLPYVISQKLDGATTVAGTMIAAHMAGIKLFVTGGIGGVHRGAGESFDISADLEELKMTDVTVVCAGAKAILDIPATLEYLETAGVPVIAYGTDEIPAFYSRKSGEKANCRMDSPEESGRPSPAQNPPPAFEAIPGGSAPRRGPPAGVRLPLHPMWSEFSGCRQETAPRSMSALWFVPPVQTEARPVPPPAGGWRDLSWAV